MNGIEIKVTPETLVTVSTDVTQKISKVQSAFAELEGIIQNTSSYWEGDGHDKCVGAYQLRKENYQNILNEIIMVIKLNMMTHTISVVWKLYWSRLHRRIVTVCLVS